MVVYSSHESTHRGGGGKVQNDPASLRMRRELTYSSCRTEKRNRGVDCQWQVEGGLNIGYLLGYRSTNPTPGLPCTP